MRCPVSVGWRHSASMAVVSPVLDPKSRTEEHRKLKLAGRKPMRRVTRDPI